MITVCNAILFLLLNNSISLGQGGCQCDMVCPPQEITGCDQPWSTPQIKTTVTVNIPYYDVDCEVDVVYCCRQRNYGGCERFVDPSNIIGSSELIVSCIRIPKWCTKNEAPVGQPMPNPARQQFLDGLVEALICQNLCNFEPPPSNSPGAMEWLFSFPHCYEWLKTGGPTTAWCLTSCSDNDYCVYGYKIQLVGTVPTVIKKKATHWTQKGQIPNCPQDPDCIVSPCKQSAPDCDFFE